MMFLCNLILVLRNEIEGVEAIIPLFIKMKGSGMSPLAPGFTGSEKGQFDEFVDC